MILNDNGLKYVKIEREYVVDHSVISNGVSILQPGSQTKMLFKTLNPNLKCVFLAEKENGFIEENSVLNMRIQYIMVPLGFTFVDGISNLDMNDIIESKNLDLFTYEGVVKAVSLENCSGILVFKRL